MARTKKQPAPVAPVKMGFSLGDSIARNPYKIVLTRSYRKNVKVMAWCSDLIDAAAKMGAIQRNHAYKGYLIVIDRKTGKEVELN